MKKIIPLLVGFIMITSCNQNTNDYESLAVADVEVEETYSPDATSEPLAPNPLSSENTETIKKKIIKDGHMGITVQDLETVKTNVDLLLKKYEGYYAQERLNNTDWSSSYILKIRIPSSNFEKLVAGIESGTSKIGYKEIVARDVTDQFIDMETRLENKRNYLKRYNDLLKQAHNIKEILEIGEKIRQLEEEIESTAGKLKYLNDQVAYSTLDLTISQEKDFKYNPSKRDKFSERLKESISKGWIGFIDFLLFAIKIWPFWIILVLAIYLWKKLRKKK